MSEINITIDKIEDILSIAKTLLKINRVMILKYLLDGELDTEQLQNKLMKDNNNNGMGIGSIIAHATELEKAFLVTSRYIKGRHGVKKVWKASGNKIIIQIELTKGS